MVIKGINWFGFETEYQNLMCTWAKPAHWHISKINELGFNYIRLPVSLEFIENNYWNDMNEFFRLTEAKNISVVFDMHIFPRRHIYD